MGEITIRQAHVVDRNEVAKATREAIHFDGIVGCRTHRVRLQRLNAAPKHTSGRISDATPIS